MGVPQGNVPFRNIKYFGNLFVTQIKFVLTTVLASQVKASAGAGKINGADVLGYCSSTGPEPASPPELLLRL